MAKRNLHNFINCDKGAAFDNRSLLPFLLEEQIEKAINYGANG